MRISIENNAGIIGRFAGIIKGRGLKLLCVTISPKGLQQNLCNVTVQF